MKKILVVDKVDKAKRISRATFSDCRPMSCLVERDKSKYNRKQKHKSLEC